MFSAISARYDLLNHLLSAGRDRAWRRRAVERLSPGPGDLVLDLCGGTGDLALEAARRGARVVCCDFAAPMLLRAQRKFLRRPAPSNGAEPGDPRPRPLLADALRLPFPDGAFSAVTIGFGLRNLRTVEEGLAEIHRVLRPGGAVCILEFSRPEGPSLSRLYGFYLNRILPRVGALISHSEGAYGYLARTIGEFPSAGEIAGQMARCGFREIAWTHLTGGIVAVHLGRRTGG